MWNHSLENKIDLQSPILNHAWSPMSQTPFRANARDAFGEAPFQAFENIEGSFEIKGRSLEARMTQNGKKKSCKLALSDWAMYICMLRNSSGSGGKYGRGPATIDLYTCIFCNTQKSKQH